MSKVTVRAATEDDRAALEAMIADCYGEIYPDWYEAEVVETAMEHMLRIDPNLLESGRYLAAEMDGELAGCGGWSKATPGSGQEAEGIAHIRHFATSPKFMRKGIGSAILSACLDAAEQDGVKKLQCFSSLSGEAFYAGSGFERISEVAVQLGDGVAFPAILMEKRLG